LSFVWHHRVVPLLQEYFDNDGERLRVLLEDGFVKKAEVRVRWQHDSESVKLNIVQLGADDLIAATNG